jgi:hypothetical protein
MLKIRVVHALGLKGARIINLNVILIDGPAGIVEKDLIAEVDWAAGGIKMMELSKGEIYLEIKIEMNDL